MRIHFQPPLQPTPLPAPPKAMPTAFEIGQKTQELIETAQQQRLKRNNMFGDRKKNKQNSPAKEEKDEDINDQKCDIFI